MKISAIVPVFAACALLGAVPARAAESGDPLAGKAKTSMCAGCHGIPGYRTVFPDVYHVPKLGGQHAAYLVKALQEYKAGNRNHPTMRAIAASLSDKDMADLAAYYASGAAKTAGKAAGNEKSKTCAACHGPDGNSPVPDFPRLADQHYDYLVKTITAYQSGARKSPVMAPMVANLSKRDIEDLAAFYSQQQGLVVKY